VLDVRVLIAKWCRAISGRAEVVKKRGQVMVSARDYLRAGSLLFSMILLWPSRFGTLEDAVVKINLFDQIVPAKLLSL